MGSGTKMEMNKNFEQLERDKFILLPNILAGIDTFKQEKPNRVGQVEYNKKTGEEIDYKMTEQVQGSLARYNHPLYKDLHYQIKNILQEVFDIDLYPTYYYDRFYSPDQELLKHRDRPSCEISVSILISSNTKDPWPLWFDSPTLGETKVITNIGDICVYKGCEVIHWREKLSSNHDTALNILDDDTYHHQLFLHYVNANGNYLQFAFDNR